MLGAPGLIMSELLVGGRLSTPADLPGRVPSSSACTCLSCSIHHRGTATPCSAYPTSSITDAQWAVLEPLLTRYPRVGTYLASCDGNLDRTLLLYRWRVRQRARLRAPTAALAGVASPA